MGAAPSTPDDGQKIGYCKSSDIDCSEVSGACGVLQDSAKKDIVDGEAVPYKGLGKNQLECSDLRKKDCFFMMNEYGVCAFDTEKEMAETEITSQGNAPDPDKKDIFTCGNKKIYVEPSLTPEMCHCINNNKGVSCNPEIDCPDTCPSGQVCDRSSEAVGHDDSKPWIKLYKCKDIPPDKPNTMLWIILGAGILLLIGIVIAMSST